MTKQIQALLVLVVMTQSFPPTPAQVRKSQQNPGKQKDMFLQKSSDRKIESDVLLKAMIAYTLRIHQRYPDEQLAKDKVERMTLELGMGAAMFIDHFNAVWVSETLQSPLLEKYLSRIPAVPIAFEDEWSDTLERVSKPTMGVTLKRWSTGRILEMPVLLGTIIAQDRIFIGQDFNEKEAKKLLKRLSSLPYEAVEQWTNANQFVWRQYVAASLITYDDMFTDDVFQKELFDKKLKVVTTKK